MVERDPRALAPGDGERATEQQLSVRYGMSIRTGPVSSLPGAAPSRGATVASQRNPTRSCDLSQRGLFSDAPQRQKAMRVTGRISAPGVSSISRLPRA